MYIYKLFLLVGLFSMVSCVSSNRYEEALAEKRGLEERVMQLEKTQKEFDRLKSDYASLNEQNASLKDELERCQTKYSNMNQARKDLQEVYDKIVAQNKQLLETSSSEKRDLLEELNDKRNMLDQRESELNKTRREILEKENQLGEMMASLRDKEARIEKLNERLDEMNSTMGETLKSIEKALTSFGKDEFSVRQENGRVYISLSQKLLFEKGSSKINPRGQSALEQLAKSMKEMNDLSFTVEGHTDSDGSVERNWELSTERATEVVLYLQKEGVDPNDMVASGRALYQPVAPNTDEDNKRLNRRTEIIINPDLEEIFELLQSPKQSETE
jgi:chemotaxis protein MotB